MYPTLQRRARGPLGGDRRPSAQAAATFGVSDIPEPSTETPLHTAADDCDEREVRRLLRLGYDPNARNARQRVRALGKGQRGMEFS